MLTPHSFQLSQPRCALLFLPKNFSTLLSLFHSRTRQKASRSLFLPKNPLLPLFFLSFSLSLTLSSKKTLFFLFPSHLLFIHARERNSFSLIHPFFQKPSLSLLPFFHFILSFKKGFPSFFRRIKSYLFLSLFFLFSSLSLTLSSKKPSSLFFPLLHLFFTHVQTLSLSLTHPPFLPTIPATLHRSPPSQTPFFPSYTRASPFSLHSPASPSLSLFLSDDDGRDGGGGNGKRAQLGGWNGWIRSVGIATRCRP